MAAIIQIDQVGLPAGTAGKSRSDGLATGATVTVTSTGAGTTHTLEFDWVPSADTTAVSTLTPVGGTSWTFTPTPGVFGSYRLRLTVDGEISNRIFAIRFPVSGLRMPALNEIASPLATLGTGAGLVDESEYNEDIAGGPFASGNYGGYFPDLEGLFTQVEALANIHGGGTATPPSDIYIAAVAGDDNNDGLTPATAVQTLARANAILENVLGNTLLTTTVTYHLDSNFHEYDVPPAVEFSRQGLLIYYGDGAGQAGDDGFTEAVVGTTASPSTLSYEIFVTGPLPVNAYTGWVLEFTDSGYEGFRRTIARNTATEIYIANGFGTTTSPGALVPAGVGFRIVSPGAYLFNDKTVSSTFPSRSFLGLVNIGLYSTLPCGAAPAWILTDSTMVTFGLDASRQGSGFGQIITCTGSVLTSGGISSNTFSDVILKIAEKVTGSGTGLTGGALDGWGMTASLADVPAFGSGYNTSFGSLIPSEFSGYAAAGAISVSQPGLIWYQGGRINSGFILNGAFVLIGMFSGVAKYATMGKQSTVDVDVGSILHIRIFSGGRVEFIERNGTLLNASRGSRVLIDGSDFSMTSNSSAMITVSEDSLLACTAASTLTATGSATIIDSDRGVVRLTNGDFDASASSGDVLNLNQSKASIESSADVLGGSVVLDGGSNLVVDAGTNVFTAVDAPITIKDSKLSHRGGTISATATGGAAVTVSGGQARFLGGASVALSGTTYGLTAKAGSSVEFEGDLSGVSGTTDDLQVDNSDVSQATLASAGDFVSGVPVGGSPGSGGGSRVGRS